MNLTQDQLREILGQIAQGENGYQKILQLSIEAIMRSERTEFNPFDALERKIEC